MSATLTGELLPVLHGAAEPPFAIRMPAVESTDSLVAARLVAGDERALAELFRCVAPAVYAAAIRLVRDAALAEDVVQDVFIDLWCHPSKYQPALGSLRNYLCLRAQHRVLDLLRSDLRRLARQQRRERMTPDTPQPTAADRIINAELGEAVRAAVRRLPTEQQELIELTYFQGLSYRDAARCAGIPEGTAKSRLRLAFAKLETLLARDLLETT